MRIIGGRYSGKTLKVAKGLPVRPTTDFAKEALFNILNNRVDFESIDVLDLFSGTGHIALEFASRGSKQVTAVDEHIKCVMFLKQTADQLSLNIHTVKDDVFRFLENSHARFDLIFADPPYDLENIPRIHELVFSRELLNRNGYLIIEHGSKTNLEGLPNFLQHRKYGNVHFSFFQAGSEEGE
jgi:16S rRNA (guanine(966)-N(2))-methyltransferase RsmD